MQFSFTDEQEQFRAVLRRFLEDKSPPGEVRRLMATDAGYDPGVWRQLSEELGLPGLHIPEAYGGQGFGFVELGIVLEEMGRALLCAPYFGSSVLGAIAILEAGSEDQKRTLLPSIAAGETLAALAFAEPGRGWDAREIALTATAADGAFRLDGAKQYVLDGHIADRIVVAARDPGSTGTMGLGLYLVAGDARGLTRRLLQTLDPTRKQAHLELDGVAAERLGEAATGAAALARTLRLAAVALANEMVGGAQRLLDSAVDYAKLRMQFGRPIGSFQAIKHKLADMLLDVELAKSAAYYAAAAVVEDAADLPATASLAKACASDAYLRTAAECIQIHGGIGFTWENDTHLWFKRAKSSEVLLGDPTYHRELLMRRWDAAGAR